MWITQRDRTDRSITMVRVRRLGEDSSPKTQNGVFGAPSMSLVVAMSYYFCWIQSEMSSAMLRWPRNNMSLCAVYRRRLSRCSSWLLSLWARLLPNLQRRRLASMGKLHAHASSCTTARWRRNGPVVWNRTDVHRHSSGDRSLLWVIGRDRDTAGATGHKAEGFTEFFEDDVSSSFRQVCGLPRGSVLAPNTYQLVYQRPTCHIQPQVYLCRRHFPLGSHKFLWDRMHFNHWPCSSWQILSTVAYKTQHVQDRNKCFPPT